ncbi:MAG TPA: chromosomal replication initiator protein DnaA [Solirubrobacteraceae bacterium]|nr:chromosomal replication initiator protein DnaA [Solirubrobacteraceae bacterium]
MLPAHTDPDDAWQVLRAELRRRIGPGAFDLWLAGLELASWDGQVMVLAGRAETELWVSRRYGRLLGQAAEDVLGPGTRLRFAGGERAVEPSAGPVVGGEPFHELRAGFNPRYRFEQFIIGETNRLAHAGALAVAENPGQAYNPLFIYAPPGLGKTHLLHAIGNYVLQFGAGASVRYTTAEAFTNHFVSALSSRSIETFKHAYRTADVLLIDDVQFLAAKARTEEEFFHTFNALYENGRQLVLTCDRLPRALTTIEQRLRERFEAGLVADIKPPDHATRVAILRKRAALDGIELADPDVIDLIADRVRDNIRLLEGALIRVVAFHSLTHRAIDVPLTSEVLDVMYPEAPSPGRSAKASGATPSIESIQAAVAAHFGLTVDQLTSASRKATINWARQVAMALVRDLTGASLPTIGRAFGGRNHATVHNALQRVSDRLAGDQEAVDNVQQLRRQLTGERGGARS